MPPAKKFIAAVAQPASAFFDTQANLTKAIEAIYEAGREGASIIVFPECYLGQFPYWAQYYQVPAADFNTVQTALFDGAVSVDGDECRAISRAARQVGIHVVMGANELSDEPGSVTLYNSMFFFDRQGTLYHRHRKLKPTYAERLIHGQGDGRGLRVHDTDLGRLGGLICWENHMTLSKYAMASMGEEIHVASWPGTWRAGNPQLGERIMEPEVDNPANCDKEVAVREYATETGNFVLSAANYLPSENIADAWRERIPSLQADWATGGSSIVAPGGAYLAEPVMNQEALLLAEIDMNERRLWKAWFDPLGHYSRPDVYSLQIHDTVGREHAYRASPPASGIPAHASEQVERQDAARPTSAPEPSGDEDGTLT